MTEQPDLRVINGERPESLTELVAKRLRGQLAERRIKHKEVIELTGWGKTTMHRKVNGKSALDTDELEVLWRLFRISPSYLLTGVADDRPRPGGPDGGGGGSRLGESNPRPSHYRPGGIAPIVQLPRKQASELRPTG